MFAAALLGSVLGGAMWLVWMLFIIFLVLGVVANAGKFKCPYCAKRVKLGASVCHHCGRTVQSWSERLGSGGR